MTRLAFLMILVAGSMATHAAEPPVDFAREVRPLLNAHCVACHGGVKMAGGISFLARETAVAEGDSGEPAIVPGSPDASSLIRRVTSGDEDERMPPPGHGRSLTAAEIDVFRRWIAAGANWKRHWSFEPPVDHPAPAPKDASWPRVPFDAFVAARLDAEGLTAARPASPAEWLRRVSLDLTGLPPTIDDYEAFRADGGGGHDEAADRAARIRQVDRLLASPHFGERWASVWLDLARYADTFGFEKDPTRTIWPWRDWVIRAFNDDMPYDRFTVSQLAGDLMPEPTADDLLATAFHRNTQTNTEGGTDDEEFRMAAVLDRVNTTWTAWQGTTFGCVQCHAHPYDPYPHADYYRFVAYLDGTQDRDLNEEFPTLPVPADPQAREALPALLRTIDSTRKALNAAGAAPAAAGAWRPVTVHAAATTGGTIAATGDGWLKAGGTLPVGARYDLDIDLPPNTTAIRIDIPLESGRGEAAPPERGAVLSHVTIELPAAKGAAEPRPVPVAIAEVFADAIDGPFDPDSTLHPDPDGFGGYPTMDRPRWCVLVFAEPETLAAGGRVKLTTVQAATSHSGFQACSLRDFRITTAGDPRWTELVRDAARRDARARLDAARRALAAAGGPQVPVLRELDPEMRRRTHIFTRGNRLDCGDRVVPGIPAVVGPPAPMPADRLGMAEWLVGDTNPLAARVLANRLWAEMFGTGIVESLDDFGSSGARPSHPDLLDHLAVRLRCEHRWSVKAFVREIALSATYGQTAATPADLLARDPHNRLLARGPRSRLTAEMVRDQALVWSGLFTPTLFGPPVFPPQPEGIWRSVYSGATWTTSEGPDRFRRAIYTFVKRTAGYPALLAFDAPSRDACTARRFPTNTPLQPLVTLNDPMFTELAAGMAKRLRAAGESTRDRITFGCRLLTLEPPPESMVDSLVRLHDAAAATDTPDLDPLAVVAVAILNLDRALVR